MKLYHCNRASCVQTIEALKDELTKAQAQRDELVFLLKAAIEFDYLPTNLPDPSLYGTVKAALAKIEGSKT